MPTPPQDISALEQRISALEEALASYSLKGHDHDGYDELKILLEHTAIAKDAWGHAPWNYKYALETSSDTLANGSDTVLISAAMTPKKTSNILVFAWSQVGNDAGTARTITFKIKNGSTTLATAVTNLPAAITTYITTSFFVLDAPATNRAVTYNLTGTTDAGSPTTTNKGIIAIELSNARDATS